MGKENLTCGRCQLYDRQNQQCKVAILYEGQKIFLPMLPDDKCFFVETQVEIDQIRVFNDDGKVKIEFPENLDSPFI